MNDWNYGYNTVLEAQYSLKTRPTINRLSRFTCQPVSLSASGYTLADSERRQQK